jgi:iron complex outermembrane receptor protein
MKSKLWLALQPAVCLCWAASWALAQMGQGTVPPAGPVAVESAPQAGAAKSDVAGRLTGAVRDPAGAVVAGAKIELKSMSSARVWTRQTNREGRFDFEEIPTETYWLTAIVSGFEMVIVRDVRVAAGRETVVNVTLRIAPVKTEVEVREQNESAEAALRKVGASDEGRRRNLGELAAEEPGVSLRESGALAGSPVLHGLGDERVKVVVNGTTEENSCPNHMNSQLSETQMAGAAAVRVLPGITPVSMGGDSLGGTVVVEGRPPVFAGAQEGVFEQGSATGSYRSNGEYYGGSVTEWAAGRHVAMGYTGTWQTNSDYTDGNGHKVTSTYAQSTEHTLTLAAEKGKNLATVEAGFVHVPYEGFVNAQMDLVRDASERVNVRYRKSLEQGAVEARAYWRGTWHGMNVGRDKMTFPMPMWMPMQTHGREMGYTIGVETPLGTRHTLRAGNELGEFRLDDKWPAVAGMAPYMGPNEFVSIDDGRRVRLGTYVEAVTRWNPAWTTLLGVRNDRIWTNAGPVQGYSSMYAADAAAFNAEERARIDADIDATADARWVPNAAWTVEFGYARKSRAPSLYERYAWSTNWMASGMIGWFGDGNYYVGNVSLGPETAHTASGSVRWMARGDRIWEIKATPFVTQIENYVDVDTLATATYGTSTFAQLQFANHDARIYGGDLSGSTELWDGGRSGTGTLSGVAGWLHGERTGSSTPLYQMMPLNARVNLDEAVKGFAGGVGVESVDRKRNVDPRRYEQHTPGYALANLHVSYRRGALEASGGVENLLNKGYELPLGGVNMDDFMAEMWNGAIAPVTGRGRSGFFSLTARF